MSEKYVSPVLEEIRRHTLKEDLIIAHDYAQQYIDAVDDMPVFPKNESLNALSIFDVPLADEPVAPKEILDELHRYGSPATVAQTGGRYFGFVCGGILPSSLASKWLTDSWDQNPAMYVMSPIASKIESVTERWLVDLLNFPEETVAGFVSGSSTATIIGLTTGRNYLLKNLGYDSMTNGLNAAPTLKVIIGEGAHSTVYKALSIIGLGSGNVTIIPADEQGRMCLEALPEIDDHTLLVLQAGHVNSGAFDELETIIPLAKEKGAYVHVDGAFGLFAASNDKFSSLTKGLELADSWSVDGHKTLNSPYDCGIILCRHEEMLIHSMHMTGSYIILSENRDNMLYTAEMSRRARAIDLWATLKGLGKNGVRELVWELHCKASYFAEQLAQHGFEVLNDVAFNQVMTRLETDEKTDALISALQQSGVCWVGGAKWKGQAVVRISVSSYKTTYEDIDLSVEDFIRQRDLIE